VGGGALVVADPVDGLDPGADAHRFSLQSEKLRHLLLSEPQSFEQLCHPLKISTSVEYNQKTCRLLRIS
jgi:hypothetical protein